MDKTQEDLLKEFYQLKEENKLLNEEKESLYRDRELAGELGKTLLQQNRELEAKLEEMETEQHDIIMKMEDLRQENYSIKSRLETETRSKGHHLDEIENMKENLHKEFDQERMITQIANDKKLKDLRRELSSLQSEIEKHNMMEGQYKEKIQQQEEMLEKTRQYHKQLQLAANLETDLEEQKQLTTELQTERDCLLMEMTQMKNTQEQLAFDKKVVQEKFQEIEEELQEKNRQAQMWYNCLQEARQESGEFKAELDMLKAEMANKDFKNKGNSLFGEVEDKRVELEKKYVSLKTQHECLVKTHTVTKQHLHKLKNQVAALLQVKGNSADVSHMQRLQQECARKEGELKMLVDKVRILEKNQTENSYTSRMKEFHEAFSDFGDKKDYINFLEILLQDEKKKIAQMQKEIETKTLLQLIESDRVRNTETQLYKAESNVEKLKAENMKLRLKIEDMKMKLQQAKSSNDQKPSNQGLTKSKSASAIQTKVIIKRVTPPSSDKSSPKESHSTSTSKKPPKDLATVDSKETTDSKQSNNQLVEVSHFTEMNNKLCVNSGTTETNDTESELASKNLTSKEPEGDISNTTCDQSLFGEISAVENSQQQSQCHPDTQTQLQSLSDVQPSMKNCQDEPRNNIEQGKRVRFSEKSPDIVADNESLEEIKENREPLRTMNGNNPGDAKARSGVILKGQRQKSKVINVGQGTKNECPQQ